MYYYVTPSREIYHTYLNCRMVVFPSLHRSSDSLSLVASSIVLQKERSAMKFRNPADL